MAAKLNLTDKQIQSICAIIIDWEGKLTWNLLVARIKEKKRLSISRVTLKSYNAVYQTFKTRKDELRGIQPDSGQKAPSVKLADALKTIERQKRQIAHLEAQNDAQLYKLKCALHNAMNHHPPIMPEELLAPLPQLIKE